MIYYEIDTNKIKISDGITTYNQLSYINGINGIEGDLNNETILTELSNMKSQLSRLQTDFDAVDLGEIGDKAEDDMVVHKKGYSGLETIEGQKDFIDMLTLSENSSIDLGNTSNYAATTKYVTDSINDLKNNLPSSGDATSQIVQHNLDKQSHNDIRNSVKDVADEVALKADSTIVDDIQSTLTTAVEDIEFLQNDIAAFVNVSKDAALKSQDNIFTKSNTFSGGITVSTNPITLSNNATIKDGVNNKNILNVLTIDNNTQQVYLGNDRAWIKGTDNILLEGSEIKTKRGTTVDNWEEYTNIDSGNILDNLPSTVAKTNSVNTFTDANTFKKSVGFNGDDSSTVDFGSKIRMKDTSGIHNSNGQVLILSYNSTTQNTYLGSDKNISINGVETVDIRTPTLTTTRSTGSGFETFTVVDSGNISNYITSSGGSVEMEKYGIEADYAVHYGIIDCPNGLIEYNTTNKDIVIKSGIVLQTAGNPLRTTIASDINYTIQETGKITLFYAQGEILEAGDVFYQENEPENGVTSYLAWYKPSLGKWQFKSNATGNVFREATATPIANVNVGETLITSISYIGYRIFDDDCFASLSDIDSINETISTLNDTINSDILTGNKLMTGTIETIQNLSESSDLTTVITAFNDLLTKLKTRGIIN